jgi:hypothetical protein
MAEPEKSNIREKFGTDYLTTDYAPPSTSRNLGAVNGAADQVSVDRAVAAFGNIILSTLQRDPNRSARIHDLVDSTGLGVETLLGVTGTLAGLGLIEVARTDKYGNHDIRITQLGEDSLKKS